MTKKTHAMYIAVIVVLGATIVWLVPGPNISVPDSSEPRTETASIAILPFISRGGGDSSDGLAAKTTTMLVDALSGSPHLRVTPEAAVIEVADRHLSIREIGRELSVSYVLEGSVASISGDLRIAVQLIDARNDAHVWAEVYGLRIDDLANFVASTKSEVLELTR